METHNKYLQGGVEAAPQAGCSVTFILEQELEMQVG